MQQLKYLVPVWNKTPTHKSQLLMKQNSESFHFELKCFIRILTSPFLISCYAMSPFSSKVLKCLILKRVKIMLLAFGNVFIKDNVLLWRTLLTTSWHFMGELSIKVAPTSFVTEIFLGTHSQPSLQLIPRLLDAGIPGWFRELRSQHAFLRHIFSFCAFRDYMNPYFSMSHTSLSLTLTTEVSNLRRKYLPALSKQIPSHIPSLAKTSAVLENGFCHGLLWLCSLGFN